MSDVFEFNSSSTNSRDRFKQYFPGGLLATGSACSRTAQLAEEFAAHGIPAEDISDALKPAIARSRQQTPVNPREAQSTSSEAKVIDLFKER